MARVMGIDPGSHITGYGVIEGEGQKICYVSSGTIRLDVEAIEHSPKSSTLNPP